MSASQLPSHFQFFRILHARKQCAGHRLRRKSVLCSLGAACLALLGFLLALNLRAAGQDAQKISPRPGVFANATSLNGTGNVFLTAEPLGTGIQIPSFAIADFNGDGKPDLAMPLPCSGCGVAVSLGKGDGTFQASVSTVNLGGAFFVATGDFNGDGKQDLAVIGSVPTNQTIPALHILLGNGDGTFTLKSTNTGIMNQVSAAVGDFNGDGKLDVAVLDRTTTGDVVLVFLGNGDGTLQAPTTINLGVNAAATQIVTADFNKDGHLDLAVSFQNQAAVDVILGNGNGTFHAPTVLNLPAGNGGYGVAVGDFNGDGVPDLVATTPNIGGVTVFLGKGDGTFTPVNNPQSGSIPTANASVPFGGAQPIAVGDFNKDGKLDVIAGLSGVNGAATVAVLLGNGDGTLQPETLYGTVDNPSFVAVADFNGDGNLDWITNANLAFYLAIGLGRGDGTFLAARNFAVGSGTVAAGVADFNKDGKLDVVTANSGSADNTILLGKGDGTFQPAVSLSVSGLTPVDVVTGDFNNDGNPDFIVLNGNGGFVAPCHGTSMNCLTVYLGKGDGTFQTPSVVSSGSSGGVFMFAGDFNGDGKLDLAIAQNTSGPPTIAILLGNGDGTFNALSPFSTGGSSIALFAIADVNKDGKLDLVVTDYLKGQVQIFLGKGDGTFQPPSNIATGRYPGGVAVADFNGDGKLDILLTNELDTTLEFFSGNGDGTFNSGVLMPLPAGFPPANVIIVDDFNLDGKLDIAFDHGGVGRNLVSGISYGMSLMLGNGDGTFQAPQDYLIGRTANPVLSRRGSIVNNDFNGDGVPDVLVIDPENYITILLNQTPPPIAVSPSSLSFGNQLVGSTSSALAVKVSNNGAAATTVSITASGDFAQTNTCPVSPATLAPAASCNISVTFKPTATGIRNGAITVSDPLPGSPQLVTLTGTGIAPAVTLSGNSLGFGNQIVGMSSAVQMVTLSNTGTATLTISSIAITGTNSGDFSQTNTCGASVAAGANCSISVTFKPTATGARAASVTITDNASGSPQSISLSGTGVAPVVGLSSSSVTFTNQPVGTTSAAQNITLSNTGNATLTFSSAGIAIAGTNSGDFSETNTCGASVAAGANCTISVKFSPTATGTRTASVTITDDAGNSPQSVSLTGTGVPAAPVASLSASNLSFGNQLVGTSSSAQSVTLTNTGNATLTFSGSGITITGTNSGDFSQTNTCGASVAAGANCAISVAFKPTATGARSASVSITDNASGSPQTVSLTGTGTAPIVSFGGTASLNFGNQLVATTSAAQTVTLTNTGTATLTFSGSGVSITGTNSGDFAETNTCGSSVAAGANCTIGITFKPTATGARSASLSVTDNASGSPQSISLAGTGVAPAVTLSGTSLTFAGQLITTTSSAQSVTLTNSGTAPLTISSIAVTGTNSGDFAQTNTCPASSATLAVNANCSISVTFTPSATGSRTASVMITDSASGSPHSVSLSGTGTDFSLAAATGSNCPSGGNCSTSATISAGSTATYDLQVTPNSGFNGAVALACSGAPGASNCTVAPASVPPSGSTNYAFTVTVGNTSNVMLVPQPPFHNIPGMPMSYAFLVFPILLLALGAARARATNAYARRILVPAMAAFFFCVLYSAGCGGGGGGGGHQPPTNAVLKVTGTSSGVNRTVNLNLTVNH